jgi:MYXO-CTERM domain-containing protein
MEDQSGGRVISLEPGSNCSPSCSLAQLTALSGLEIELVQDPGIDLAGYSITPPQFGFLGAQMPVLVGVANQHGGTLGPFTYAIDASRTLDFANPVRIHTSAGVVYPPFLAQEISAGVTPNGVTEGEYYLALIVDPNNTVSEVDENNNRVVSATRVRLLEGKPDLSVESVTLLDTMATAGQPITVLSRVRNTGSDPVTNIPVSVMLSSNPAISPQDLELGRLMLTLQPGQAASSTTTLNLPADTNTGSYYVGLFADPDGMLEELSESNNGRAAFNPIAVSGGSLAVTTTRLANAQVGTRYEGYLNASGGSGSYTWSVTQGRLPTGVALDSGTGQLYGRPNAAASESFTVEVTDGNQTASRMLSLSVVEPESPLVIVTRALSPAVVGREYSFEVLATGGTGTGTVTFSATGLPMGLSIDARGLISGVAERAESATISVTAVRDAESTMRDLVLQVIDAGTLLIDAVELPGGTLNQAYTGQLSATGGVPPITWTIENGSLPMGLTLEAQTGRITGTPLQVGTFRVVVRARDSSPGGRVASDMNSFDVTIADIAGFTVTTAGLPQAYVGEGYDVTVTTEGGRAPFTWRVAGGRLPPGIDGESSPESSTFRLIGTPSEVGEINLLFEVTDGAGRRASAPYLLSVAPARQIPEPTGPTDSGGCSCSSGRGQGTVAGLLLLAGVLALRRRRR